MKHLAAFTAFIALISWAVPPLSMQMYREIIGAAIEIMLGLMALVLLMIPFLMLFEYAWKEWRNMK